jgi:hypothetical protein
VEVTPGQVVEPTADSCAKRILGGAEDDRWEDQRTAWLMVSAG